MVKLRLHGVINRTGESPPAWIYNEVPSTRGSRCCGRAIWTVEIIIPFGSGGDSCRQAGLRLLANVICVINGQMCTLAAHVTKLSSGIGSNLLLYGKVP